MRSIIIILLLVTSGGASAETVYTYTGSPYTSFANSLTDGYTGESLDIDADTLDQLDQYDSGLYESGMQITIELVFENELAANENYILESDGGARSRYSSQLYNSDNRLLSYTFSDGVNTIYKTGDEMDYQWDSSAWELSWFHVNTDENGDILYWGLEAEYFDCGMSITFCFSVDSSWGPDPVDWDEMNFGDHASYYRNLDSGEFSRGANVTDPTLGTWSSTVVPIPAAVWLFGSALAGLGWMRRKQTV
jgi:hypothetical protein